MSLKGKRKNQWHGPSAHLLFQLPIDSGPTSLGAPHLGSEPLNHPSPVPCWLFLSFLSEAARGEKKSASAGLAGSIRSRNESSTHVTFSLLLLPSLSLTIFSFSLLLARPLRPHERLGKGARRVDVD